MLAPNGTSSAIVHKVNADLRVALDDAEVAAKLAANGASARYMTPRRNSEHGGRSCSRCCGGEIGAVGSNSLRIGHHGH
jgi:hypothetical protein